MALTHGFRGIGTANQRRHYVEAAVGDAVEAAIRQGTVRSEELFLQTKFTYVGGQDHRLPYDAGADVATQVTQSLRAPWPICAPIASTRTYSTVPRRGAAGRPSTVRRGAP